MNKSNPSNLLHSDNSDTETLSPEEEKKLEKQAAQYHHHFPKSLKLLKSLSISKSAKPAISALLLNHPKFFLLPTVAQTVICHL
jgi:hypothetical protein